MSSNQDNKGNMPEDQDNEQGGAPLVEPPVRPKSTLNPATAAYLPGKATLQALEATYQKVTQEPLGGENRPIDLSTPAPTQETTIHQPVPIAPFNLGGAAFNQSGQSPGVGNFMDDDPFVTKAPEASSSVLEQTRAMLKSYHKQLLANSGGPPGFPAYALPDNQHTKTPGLPMPTKYAFANLQTQPTEYRCAQPKPPPTNADGSRILTQEEVLNSPHIDWGTDVRPACYYYPHYSDHYGEEPPAWDKGSYRPESWWKTYGPLIKPGQSIQPPMGTHMGNAVDQPGMSTYTGISIDTSSASQIPTRQPSQTPKDAQGYNDPYNTTPPRAIQQSKNSTPAQLGSASRNNRTAMVLHKPQKITAAQVQDMQTRPNPEMWYKPNMNPQVLFFKGETYTINVAPLPPAPVPPYIWMSRSPQLQQLTGGPTGYPPIAVALDPSNFPFEATTSQPYRSTSGVIRIKNIPFNTKRCEVIALFGKNGRILNDIDEPVHIIMDRVSSKTNDCYVEFVAKEDAFRAMERFTKQCINEKPPRLGDRTIVMELSDQAELMQDLFPRATNVYWDDNLPKILPNHTDRVYGNFRGFVSEEEMVMLIKHVDSPHRAPFSKESPQRPFECIISTLKKLPWSCPEGITIRQRNAIFETVASLISRLRDSMRYGKDTTGNLNEQLLNRLVNAAMYCPGFTVAMKDDIVFMLKMPEHLARSFCLPRYSACWRHLYGLRPKPNLPLDLIEWYVAIIREETTRLREVLPLATRNYIQSCTEQETDSYFGDFWVEVHRPAGAAFENETVANCIDREIICIERVLRRALGA